MRIQSQALGLHIRNSHDPYSNLSAVRSWKLLLRRHEFALLDILCQAGLPAKIDPVQLVNSEEVSRLKLVLFTSYKQDWTGVLSLERSIIFDDCPNLSSHYIRLWKHGKNILCFDKERLKRKRELKTSQSSWRTLSVLCTPNDHGESS